MQDRNKKKHAQVTDDAASPLKRYQRVIIGSEQLGYTLRYELIFGLLKNFPGALGLWLRQRFYHGLVGKMGTGVIIGEGTIFHHPRKIVLGKKVAMSYDCLLDASGTTNRGITIGDNVIIGRSTTIVCKEGDISIGNDVGIGANCLLSAVGGNRLEIGNHVMIAPYVYIGGVSYNLERTDIPLPQQGTRPLGGSRIGDNTWLGANVTILDGVRIGHDAIVAAGAVVTKDIPAFGIAAGVPAKLLRMRGGDTPEQSDVSNVAMQDSPG
jgi:acetyltransferase-like isoleucine patch superfamily enzyme